MEVCVARQNVGSSGGGGEERSWKPISRWGEGIFDLISNVGGRTGRGSYDYGLKVKLTPGTELTTWIGTENTKTKQLKQTKQESVHASKLSTVFRIQT